MLEDAALDAGLWPRSDAWPTPAELPRLDEREVHVWRVTVPDSLPARCLEWLGADELDAFHRFRRGADAVRFATGRAALRLLLGAYFGCSARALVVDRTCRYCGAKHGKPRVAHHKNLDFNLSSSGQLVLIAVARACVVGVDVEASTRWVAAEMAALALAPSEYRTFAAAVSAEGGFELVQLWCCKEAVLKATGHGLAIDPRHLVVAPHEDAFRIVDAPPEHSELRDFTIARLALPSGYAGAIALRPLPSRLRLFEVSPDQLLDLGGA